MSGRGAILDSEVRESLSEEVTFKPRSECHKVTSHVKIFIKNIPDGGKRKVKEKWSKKGSICSERRHMFPDILPLPPIHPPHCQLMSALPTSLREGGLTLLWVYVSSSCVGEISGHISLPT